MSTDGMNISSKDVPELAKLWLQIRRLSRRCSKGNLNFGLNVMWAFVMTGLMVVFYKAPILLWALMLLVSIGVIFTNFWPHSIFYWLGFGTMIPMVEAFCIHFGVWAYTTPTIFYVPLWLFPVWANVFLIIRKGRFGFFEEILIRLKIIARDDDA